MKKLKKDPVGLDPADYVFLQYKPEAEIHFHVCITIQKYISLQYTQPSFVFYQKGNYLMCNTTRTC